MRVEREVVGLRRDIVGLHEDYLGLSGRLDNLDRRAGRTERRLDLLWSEEQAELLRRRAANALDWDNLVEEIEAVGAQ